jgi:hypothetical protein
MYLEKISANPEMTRQFDQFMTGLNTAILLGVLAVGIWIAWGMIHL